MIQKLKMQNGETLIESMVSLLIALICMGILTTSITAASKMNMETNRLDEKYALDLKVAEQHLHPTGYDIDNTATLKFDFAEDAISDKDVNINVYGGSKEENAFASYTKR